MDVATRWRPKSQVEISSRHWGISLQKESSGFISRSSNTEWQHIKSGSYEKNANLFQSLFHNAEMVLDMRLGYNLSPFFLRKVTISCEDETRLGVELVLDEDYQTGRYRLMQVNWNSASRKMGWLQSTGCCCSEAVQNLRRRFLHLASYLHSGRFSMA